MTASIRRPGGRVGMLSAAAAYLLLAVGLAGVVVALVSLAGGNELWSDTASDNVAALVLFGLMMGGAWGVALQPAQIAAGTVLMVVGGLAFAAILFWAVAPLVLGIGIAVLAPIRARRLRAAGQDAPRGVPAG